MSYVQTAERDFLGWLVGKKIGPSGGSQINVPAAMWRPRNPLNNSYLPSFNNSAYPSIVVYGKRTPTFLFQAAWKRSWVTAANINSWLFNQTNGDTDTWSWAARQATAGIYRRYDYGKCMQFDCGQASQGGPVSVSCAWDTVFGCDDANDPQILNMPGLAAAPANVTSWNGYTFPTWTSPSTDAGQALAVDQVVWSGVNQVRSWRLTLIRGQMPQHFIDGTVFAADITSGMFSGVLTIEQSPAATSTLVGAGALSVALGSTGNGVNIAYLLNQDDLVQSKETAFGTVVRTYSLFDITNGGNPATVTAL